METKSSASPSVNDAELDQFVYEHDMLKQQLETPNENEPHHLLKQIDEWKKDSINKINQLADQCRADVNQLLDKNKDQLINRFRKITNETRKGQKDDDYDERDLNMWMTQIKELKDELTKQSNICIAVDKQQSEWIKKIKVQEASLQQANAEDKPPFDRAGIQQQNPTIAASAAPKIPFQKETPAIVKTEKGDQCACGEAHSLIM
ncbi:unnamed protein product [Didymodactylos carnosus]|uniref:Uncharacterized protein n=1 Tax=Didymodactylos carnosus TaxID=1234261 RepID=A0A815J7E9_9BILA|nr:unnamed protein product [Didymodactylos carnosus]CAF4267493.1 unnamed protein product [Didymodactylos carnosus]